MWKVTFNNREYTVSGDFETCEEAWEKFRARRPAATSGYKLEQYDADTRGRKWASFIGRKDGVFCGRAIVEKTE